MSRYDPVPVLLVRSLDLTGGAQRAGIQTTTILLVLHYSTYTPSLSATGNFVATIADGSRRNVALPSGDGNAQGHPDGPYDTCSLTMDGRWVAVWDGNPHTDTGGPKPYPGAGIPVPQPSQPVGPRPEPTVANGDCAADEVVQMARFMLKDVNSYTVPMLDTDLDAMLAEERTRHSTLPKLRQAVQWRIDHDAERLVRRRNEALYAPAPEVQLSGRRAVNDTAEQRRAETVKLSAAQLRRYEDGRPVPVEDASGTVHSIYYRNTSATRAAQEKVAMDRAACERELRVLVSRLQRLLSEMPVIPDEPVAPVHEKDREDYMERKRTYNDAVRAATAHRTKLAETRARIEQLTTNQTSRRMRSPAEWQAWAKRREEQALADTKKQRDIEYKQRQMEIAREAQERADAYAKSLGAEPVPDDGELVPDDTCAPETAEELTGDLQILARRNALSESAAVSLTRAQKQDRNEKQHCRQIHLRQRLRVPMLPGALKRMKWLQQQLADGPRLLVDPLSIEETRTVSRTHSILHLAMDDVQPADWHLARAILDALFPQRNGKARAVSTEAAHRRALFKKLQSSNRNVLITIQTRYTAHHYQKILTLFNVMKTQGNRGISIILYGTAMAVREQGVEVWLQNNAKANEEKNEKRTRKRKRVERSITQSNQEC